MSLFVHPAFARSLGCRAGVFLLECTAWAGSIAFFRERRRRSASSRCRPQRCEKGCETSGSTRPRPTRARGSTRAPFQSRERERSHLRANRCTRIRLPAARRARQRSRIGVRGTPFACARDGGGASSRFGSSRASENVRGSGCRTRWAPAPRVVARKRRAHGDSESSAWRGIRRARGLGHAAFARARMG